MELALAIVVATLSSSLVSFAVGYWLWRQVLAKKLIEPHVVFEEPQKKKHILIPNQGLYEVHAKRKCKSRSDEDEWLREVDSRNGDREARIP